MGAVVRREGPESRIIVTKNYESLCQEVVQRILAISGKKIAAKGGFTIALSGGSTPKGVYSLMASQAYRDQFDWKKIHFFWGDERWVPPEDPKSNYRMAAETLLAKVDIPPGNIHPIRAKECDPDSCALFYEKELISFFKLGTGEIPRFDLILLGLGQDGHTASLFPASPALRETKRMVIAVSSEAAEERRVTLTLTAINHADDIFVLVSGREKAQVLKTILETKGTRKILPAQRVNPDQGVLWWFIDQYAASLLERTKGMPLHQGGEK